LGADISILGAGAEVAGILGESGPEIDEANADHIFRDPPGRLAEDMAENRAILEDAVKPGNYVETRPPASPYIARTCQMESRYGSRSIRAGSRTAA
jgi:hypothetical protein